MYEFLKVPKTSYGAEMLSKEHIPSLLLSLSYIYPLSTDDDCQMSKQLINIKIYKDQQTGKQPFLIGPINHNLSSGATFLGQMRSKQGGRLRHIDHPQINKLQARGLVNDL